MTDSECQQRGEPTSTGEIHSPEGRGEGTGVSGENPESTYLLPMHLHLLMPLLIESLLQALHAPGLILAAGERTSPVKDCLLDFTFCVRRYTRSRMSCKERRGRKQHVQRHWGRQVLSFAEWLGCGGLGKGSGEQGDDEERGYG